MNAVRKWLFFDDRYFNANHGFSRTLFQAISALDEPYVDPAIDLFNMAWGYPMVQYNQRLQRYVMYYQGWSIDKQKVEKSLLLAAVSVDGVTFEPLDMSMYLKEKPIVRNQVLPYKLGPWTFAEGQFFHLPSFGSTPYVALCIYRNETNGYRAVTFLSEDGLSFRHAPELVWHMGEDAPDVLISIEFDAVKREYHIYRRPSHTDRRVALSITTDFQRYSEPQVVLQPDSLDKPMTDFYGISVFSSEQNHLGFLMVYETPNYLRVGQERTSSLGGHKFFGGIVMPQLVYSDDGRHFQRFLRSSIVSKSSYSFPCVYPTTILKEANRWLLYASATTEEHGYTSRGKGCIAAYQIRPDGFCGMATGHGIGELTTKQWRYGGGDLIFNLACPEGTASIQIADFDSVPISGYAYEDCIPFQGDSLNHVFRFQHSNMDQLMGRILVLSIRGQNLTVYSVTGWIEKVTPYQALKEEPLQ